MTMIGRKAMWSRRLLLLTGVAHPSHPEREIPSNEMRRKMMVTPSSISVHLKPPTNGGSKRHSQSHLIRSVIH